MASREPSILPDGVLQFKFCAKKKNANETFKCHSENSRAFGGSTIEIFGLGQKL